MNAPKAFETDTIPTAAGNLVITFLGHGSLGFSFQGLQIYVDPYSKVADYTGLPNADIILVTHEHRDHLDRAALESIRTNETAVVISTGCVGQVSGGIVLRNGERETVHGLRVEAVPAYNRAHRRPEGQPFHPKGVGNGYIVTFGDTRVYIAGDTEDIPEMSSLKDIDVAFLPMNLPYTMTPEMVASAARTIKPKVLYPYHFGETDTALLAPLLADLPEVEIRIRAMA